MSAALRKAYASNTETPLETYEFTHSSLTGGVLRLVKGFYDLDATLENASSVTFSAAGINSRLPEKSTDGNQSIELTLDNTNGTAWTQINLAIEANRTSEEPVICKYRPYLESDTSAPAGSVFTFTVLSSSTNRNAVTLQAAYTPLPEVTFPRGRYYATNFPWLKYV
jgi:hypothetical protein